MARSYYYLSHKKNNIVQTEKTYRDGIPKKQPNKVGTHDTTVPLRTPIPISFDIFPPRMIDRDVYIPWQFLKSTLVCRHPSIESAMALLVK